LKINERNCSGNYPFLKAIFNNDIEIMELIIKYAEKSNIDLEINKGNSYGDYPFLVATDQIHKKKKWLT